MEFDNLIKSSGKEVVNFSKKNGETFATLSDLKAARDSCKTKGARVLIETLIAPLQKSIQRECANFDAKMSAIWKPAKGQDASAEVKKKLDGHKKDIEKSFRTISGGPEGITLNFDKIEVTYTKEK
jgi:hypothetical protein